MQYSSISGYESCFSKFKYQTDCENLWKCCLSSFFEQVGCSLFTQCWHSGYFSVERSRESKHSDCTCEGVIACHFIQEFPFTTEKVTLGGLPMGQFAFIQKISFANGT